MSLAEDKSDSYAVTKVLFRCVACCQTLAKREFIDRQRKRNSQRRCRSCVASSREHGSAAPPGPEAASFAEVVIGGINSTNEDDGAVLAEKLKPALAAQAPEVSMLELTARVIQLDLPKRAKSELVQYTLSLYD